MPLIGYIVNFRLGGKRQYPKQAIIEIPGVDNRSKAAQFLNRRVEWVRGKTRIVGVLKRIHGRKGRVIAYFRRGLPGQAIGTTVLIR